MKKLIFILLIAFLISDSTVTAKNIFQKIIDFIFGPKDSKPEQPDFCETLSERLAGFCNIIRGQPVFEEIVHAVRNDEIEEAVKKCVDTPHDESECNTFVERLKKYLE